VSAAPDLRGADLQGADRLVLMDCEWTCWEDSQATRWADAARPPEIIEVGLAAFDVCASRAVATFTALVRPRVNPKLSDYCRTLLHIGQDEIDRAPGFAVVTAWVADWQVTYGIGEVSTCAWGSYDRVLLAEEARRARCPDPFARRAHVDLMALARQRFGVESRDDVRRRCRLGPNPDRHRALADALDLVQFIPLFRS
jgi:inhibitor of KinA sporulation pathway (predicted exonuclease)